MPPTPTSQTAHPVAEEGSLALFLRAGELRGEMSRAEAARLVGIRSDELAKIERGETSQVRWVTLLKIMRAYRCSLTDLVDVRDSAPAVEPAYAKGLAALQSGALKPGLPPRRYRPDNDADEAAGAPAGDAVEREFGEQVQPKRGRKAPFRSIAKQPA